MSTSSSKISKSSPLLAKQFSEEQHFHDVLLLLESLVVREESTIKPILDSLYDVASNNLIDKKCSSVRINKILKLIAKMPKSAFKIIAWHWFKTNCPQLITNWLQEQVAFSNDIKTTTEVIVDSQADKSKSLASSTVSQNQEVNYLRTEVKLLIGTLIVVITAFSGSFFWMSYELKQSHLQEIEQLKTQIEIKQKTANRNQ